jgi:hypothetical protein
MANDDANEERPSASGHDPDDEALSPTHHAAVGLGVRARGL